MPEILKISIALTGAQFAILRSAVDAGEYATTSEAVREAVREWHRRREALPKKPRRAVRSKARKRPMKGKRKGR